MIVAVASIALTLLVAAQALPGAPPLVLPRPSVFPLVGRAVEDSSASSTIIAAMSHLKDMHKLPSSRDMEKQAAALDDAEDHITNLISAASDVKQSVGAYATPETDQTCEHLASIKADALSMHDDLLYDVEPYLVKTCTMIDAIVEGCDMVPLPRFA